MSDNKSIKLCIDEWNIWNSTPRGEDNRYGVKMVYNWRDALWVSCMMNTFVHYADDIAITNLAQMVNVLAPILTAGDQSYVQTVYPVMKLYRDHLSGKRINCKFDSPVFDAEFAGQMSALDASASLRDDDSICLFVTNLSQDTSYTVELPSEYAAKDWISLSADSFDAFNTLDREVVISERKSASHVLPLAPGTVNLILMKTGE